MAVGLIVGLAASIAGSVAIGVTVGMATGFALGLGGALLLRSAGDLVLNGVPIGLDIVSSSLIGMTSGLAGGLAYGVGVGVTRDEMAQQTARETAVPDISILRQVSGMMVGILIGLIAGFLARLMAGHAGYRIASRLNLWHCCRLAQPKLAAWCHGWIVGRYGRLAGRRITKHNIISLYSHRGPCANPGICGACGCFVCFALCAGRKNCRNVGRGLGWFVGEWCWDCFYLSPMAQPTAHFCRLAWRVYCWA